MQSWSLCVASVGIGRAATGAATGARVVSKNIFRGIHVSEAGQIDVPRGQFVFAAGVSAGPGSAVSFVICVISAGAHFFVGSFLAIGPVVFVAFVIDDRGRCG